MNVTPYDGFCYCNYLILDDLSLRFPMGYKELMVVSPAQPFVTPAVPVMVY